MYDCVANVPLDFPPFVSLWLLLGGGAGGSGGGWGMSSVLSDSFSISNGGTHTAEVPFIEVWACTLDAVEPSAGSVVLVHLCFGLVSVSLKGVLSLY